MRVIIRHKQFLKDLAKLNLSDKHFTKLVRYLGSLVEAADLPEESKDHPLIGNWSGVREFHVSGDLLVIYKATDAELILVRIGSHSQLFE
jgi:mRNA interferase YafQ